MRTSLYSGPSAAVSVCRYAPGERRRAHTDTHSRISLVLRGAYREEANNGAVTMRPGDVLLKSRRALHEDTFSDQGATLVALEFHALDPFDEGGTPDLWRRRADGLALRHAIAFLDAAIAGDGESAAAAGIDLLSTAQETPGVRAEAPVWLKRLRHDLEDAGLATINVAARAHEAGVHPVHASRLFRQCFGQSVTEFAQDQSVRRAIAPLARNDISLSEIALEAGFYDQSHMSRVFRRVIGRTPGAQRALMAAVC